MFQPAKPSKKMTSIGQHCYERCTQLYPGPLPICFSRCELLELRTGRKTKGGDFQVVLVDDASDMPHLGEPLDSYISRWRGKVELVRSGEMVRLD